MPWNRLIWLVPSAVFSAWPVRETLFPRVFLLPRLPRVMAPAVTRGLGGSAACTREAEPPQEHDLAEPSHELGE